MGAESRTAQREAAALDVENHLAAVLIDASDVIHDSICEVVQQSGYGSVRLEFLVAGGYVSRVVSSLVISYKPSRLGHLQEERVADGL